MAWSRTSLGVLGNGVLLLVRDLHSYGSQRLVLAGLALVIALSTHLIGIRRQRVLRRRPLPERVTPRGEVRIIEVSVLILIGATAILLPV